jgi:hypothetical protein
LTESTTFPLSDPDDERQFQFSSLNQQYRSDIVEDSANFSLPGGAYVEANTLELTALGANTDLLGQWNRPDTDPGGNLVAWHHVAFNGRDQYVKLVTRGWMFPLGHEAALLQISEREILNDPVNSGWADAYVGIRFFIKIIQATKTYPAPGQPFGTNDWPFTSVTFLTLTSPELDPQQAELTNLGTTAFLDDSSSPDTQALLLTSAHQPVVWAIKATDIGGNELHLQVPLVFVHGEAFEVVEHGKAPVSPNWQNEYTQSVSLPWVKAYNTKVPDSYKQANGHGQPLKLAPEAGGPAGGTTHPALMLELGAANSEHDPIVQNPNPSPYPAAPSPSTLANDGQPAFYPVLANVSVRIKAADALTGKSPTSPPPAPPSGSYDPSSGANIQYYVPFVINGLPGGDPPSLPSNGVYAALTDAINNAGGGLAGPLMGFAGNLAGGLGLPNMGMAGLSSLAGPIGGALSDLENYANTALGDLSQAKDLVTGFFNNPGAALMKELPTLFGGLKLTDILAGFLSDLLGGVPNLTVTADQPKAGDITVGYKLQANTEQDPAGIYNPGTIDNPKTNGSFNLNTSIVISLSGAPTYDVEGSLDEFVISLIPGSTFIQIPFNGFKFSAKSGSKTKVDPSVGQVQFAGALSFVNTLEQFLQDLGGSGLSISITPTEVDASFALSLPEIAVGVFTLSGIAFGTGVTIPFFGDPALMTFTFASQDNPFTLTVCMFGGGGFLALGLGFSGVQTVQASFQFEGNFSLDIYIASGSITLAAGVYYAYGDPTSPSPGTTLTGFVKLKGSLQILIFTASIELDLTLTYTDTPTTPNSVTGTATLKISVGVCFFSITIPITVTKTFSGGGGGSSHGPMAHVAEARHALIVADPAPVSPPMPPVAQVYFTDIVPDQGTWQQYCNAFAG